MLHVIKKYDSLDMYKQMEYEAFKITQMVFFESQN